MHELHRVALGERAPAGEQLEEGDAEGVEVGALVDAAADAAGLLGRHVGERADQAIGGGERDRLGGERGGDGEVGQPTSPVRGLRMMLAGLMSLWITPCSWIAASVSVTCRAMLRKLPTPTLEEALRQRQAAEVLEHEERQAALLERERLDDAAELEPRGDVVLVAQLGEPLVRHAVGPRDLEDDQAAVGDSAWARRTSDFIPSWRTSTVM